MATPYPFLLLLTLSLTPAGAMFGQSLPQRDPGRDSANALIAVLNKRVSVLELKLLEKDAQVEDLQSRLDETRTAVVNARSQVQMANGRAGAASGMAEAEVALRSLRAVAPPQYPDVQQATRLLRQSSQAFDHKNYGGAIFLAGQSKTVALTATNRLGAGNRLRTAGTGEAPFAIPIRLRVTTSSIVRERPGSDSPVVFPVSPGVALTGLSYVDDWIRVTDDRRRTGWINFSVVGRR
ncbi:MAG: SH3 domain-containing protein [Gemmatimonadota bacterium]|nr:SH3 domain-containing protein [Gemmatimonadota bacterium]